MNAVDVLVQTGVAFVADSEFLHIPVPPGTTHSGESRNVAAAAASVIICSLLWPYFSR